MTETPRRTAVLHIGPMKTGSTSIQSWLKTNRAALADAGVGVPLGEAAHNLSRLAAIFQGKRRAEAQNKVNVVALTAALAALGPDVRTCVLSGELMAQHMGADGVANLRAALQPFFSDWLVILYLRRQDEIEASRLTTLLRRGSDRERFAKPIDYAKVIDAWAGVFGREAIRPRLFARDCLVGGDVVADFVATAGLPELAAGVTGKAQNASLLPEAQALLGKVSERFGGEDDAKFREQQGHGALLRTLAQEFGGAGLLPARAEAQAFVAQVAASNERVRAEWFPARAALFSDDFSRYPEAATPEPSAEAQLKVAVAVIAGLIAGGQRRGKKRGGAGTAAAGDGRGDGDARARRRAKRQARRAGA